MTETEEIEYKLAIKDFAAATLKRLEESLARVDKQMLSLGATSTSAMNRGSTATRTAATQAEVLKEQVRGLGPALGIATSGLEKMGATGAAAAVDVVGSLINVGKSAGVAATAVAAVGLTFLAISKTMEAIKYSSLITFETIDRGSTEQAKKFAELSRANRQLRDEDTARSRGISVEALQSARAIEQQTREIKTLQGAYDKLKREGNSEGDIWGIFYPIETSEAAEMKKAFVAMDNARGVIEELQAGLTFFYAAQFRARQETWDREERALKGTLAAQASTLATETARMKELAKIKGENLAPLEETRRTLALDLKTQLAQLDQEQLANVNAQETEEVAAAKNDQVVIAGIRKRFEDLRARLPSLLAPLKAAMTAASAATVRDAEATAGQAAAAGNRELMLATRDFARQTENLKRDSYEAQLADLEASYQKEKYLAQRQGLDLLALAYKYEEARKLLAARYSGVAGSRQLTREKEDIQLNEHPDDFAGGFSARMDTITSNIQTIGQLGATTATTIADSFSQSFVDIATGTKSASAAFKSMAKSVVDSLAQILAQQAALGLITSVFGGTPVAAPTPTTVPTAGGRAEGGIVTKRELSWIGERGAEAVIPLSRNRKVPVEMRGMQAGYGGATHVDARSMTVNVNATDMQSFRALLGRDRETLWDLWNDGVNRNSKLRRTLQGAARSG